MRLCGIEGCDRVHKARGLCKLHYWRWDRGTLDNPRYAKPRPGVGTKTQWPYEVSKIDGEWHRRPTDSDGAWEIIPGFRPHG